MLSLLNNHFQQPYHYSLYSNTLKWTANAEINIQILSVLIDMFVNFLQSVK